MSLQLSWELSKLQAKQLKEGSRYALYDSLAIVVNVGVFDYDAHTYQWYEGTREFDSTHFDADTDTTFCSTRIPITHSGPFHSAPKLPNFTGFGEHC